MPTSIPKLLQHRVLPTQAKQVRADLARIAAKVAGASTLVPGSHGPAVESLQRTLRGLGLYAGKLTGTFDAATQKAVEALEARKGLPVDGLVDGAELKAMRGQELFVKSGFETRAVAGQKGSDIRDVESKLRDLGFRPGKVDGAFDKQTGEALRRFRRADPGVPDGGRAIGPKVLSGLRKQVHQVESRLELLGGEAGKVDSRYTDATRAAVSRFQRKHQLTPTGIADAKTRAALAKAAVAAAATNLGAGSTWKPDVAPSKFQHGYDLSHWQTQTLFNDVLNRKSTRFIGIKATDGTSYVDPTFKTRWAQLGKKLEPGKFDMRLAYHFLQPGNGTAQANHFLKTLGINGPLKPGTRLALDWEASALSSPQTLKDAAKRVHQVTGTWPLIYTSASRIPQARSIVPKSPLWPAHWPPQKSDYKNPFVQTSGTGIDRDIFAGSERALRRWAGWV